MTRKLVKERRGIYAVQGKMTRMGEVLYVADGGITFCPELRRGRMIWHVVMVQNILIGSQERSIDWMKRMEVP